MDRQPTEEQTKKGRHNMEDIILVNNKLNEWCGTQGINYYEGDTALGYLFKYAIPALSERLKDVTKILELLKDWVIDFTFDGTDPAITLFWAIWEVIHGDLG